MTFGSPRAVCGLLLAAAVGAASGGCRATATVNQYDGGGDAGVPDLAPPEDLYGVDFTVVPDLACSAPAGPEICGNGCDDDRNGYVDDDDPACTTQMIVTFAAGSPTLGRVILEPQPRIVVLDGNPVQAGAFGEYRRAFSSAAFLAVENGTEVRRIELTDGGGGAGAFTDYHPASGYATRDVCVFNGELIVVERNSSSTLHRLMPDGATEIGTVPLGAVLATACASDGNNLYVAVHDALGQSSFFVFDKTYTQTATLGMPAALAAAGYLHCLDIAWTKKQGVFYGLFTTDLNPKDSVLSADQIFPFAFDGGSGAPLDAGIIHGIGEFVP
ncbi:MAG TPA: hypothetical protein VFF06_01395 [Polyangia bacterium]|nr:hypothetical protein [Polyangia bacterium]